MQLQRLEFDVRGNNRSLGKRDACDASHHNLSTQ